MSVPRILLYAEDFSSHDGTRRLIGEFATQAEARISAETRIAEDLNSYHRESQSPEDQVRLWMMFGEDLFLVPNDPTAPFSALDHARRLLGIVSPTKEE